MFAVDTITQALDAHQVVCTAFLDLRKAFNSLDHVILLKRLSALGIRDTALSWFTNYLSNRTQHVRHRDMVCSWSPVKGGIPQGSTLGSLLFLVYVNEMPSLVKHGRLLQFANDTTSICSGENHDTVKKRLSFDLQRI